MIEHYSYRRNYSGTIDFPSSSPIRKIAERKVSNATVSKFLNDRWALIFMRSGISKLRVNVYINENNLQQRYPTKKKKNKKRGKKILKLIIKKIDINKINSTSINQFHHSLKKPKRRKKIYATARLTLHFLNF
ncbi:hypothetical protein PUN28_007997 [Cardiocondyla obscurior]|uniref:Uncharacterized protein n=1 Tax=Cardiocondyla obscurior TaxID=286306 RepID=A0AAW2G0W6_9HYME